MSTAAAQPTAIDLHRLDAYQRTRVRTLQPVMLAIATAGHRQHALESLAPRIGVPWRTLRNLFYRWQEEGDAALVNRAKLKRPASLERRGTPRISGFDRKILRQYALKTDSVAFAIEAFADSENCGPELREYIARYRATRNYPTLLRRAARTSSHERDLARGNKAFGLRGWVQLRRLTWIDSTGVEHPMVGGDLFECDDMSLNQPFWYEWPYGGDPLSDRFGVRLGRQMLACIDVARFKWLGFDLVGRVRDAYRAEDVVRFLGRIGSTHGLPRLGFRLERGAWAARAVRGVKGADDEEERQIIGSIADVVDLHYVHESRSKGCIEGSFDMLQTILALEGIQIGRTRGEYEKTTALMLAVNSGRKHPADYGFPHITEAAERIERAMGVFDARPKLGRTFQGIPQERFAEEVCAEPLRPIAPEHRHLFCPVKQVRPINGGHVRVNVPHYHHTFSFRVPGECAHLGAGYRLLVCFDPADPHAGAYVFDAESEGRRAWDVAAEQPYGTFAFADDVAQIDQRKGAGDYSGKRTYLAAARTAFRATGMVTGTGASVDQVADGRGNVARVERGTAAGRASRADRATPAHAARSALATAAQNARDHQRDLGPATAAALGDRRAAELLLARDHAAADCPYDL